MSKAKYGANKYAPVKVETFRTLKGGTTVYNMRTYSEHAFVLNARDAVIAAYAQERGDFNTANYEKRYGDRIRRFGVSWYLGDWAAVER